MTGNNDKGWKDYIGRKPSSENRKISLQIPDMLLDSITLPTTNEDILLPALTVIGSIHISSNGENITFGNPNIGNTLCLTVKNGDISGTIIPSVYKGTHDPLVH